MMTITNFECDYDHFEKGSATHGTACMRMSNAVTVLCTVER